MSRVKNMGSIQILLFFSGKLGVSDTGDYFAEVPVGNKNGAVLSKVLQSGDDAIVLCISCYRAHGTPYADMLRWDYENKCTTNSTDDECGCIVCHLSLIHI